MSWWLEPTENSEEKKPQYPYNNATVTASGHSFEMDDTPGNERVRMQHRSGSYSEYQVTGNVVNKIVGQGYNIYLKDNNVVIQGKCTIEVYGDAEISCNDLTVHAKGDADIHIEGDLDLTCDGDTTLTTSGDTNITGSTVTLQAVDAVYIDSDLHVTGDIIGEQSVAAYGNLTAGGHCGITGAIQVMGIKPASPSGIPLPNIINNMIGTVMVSPLLSITAITSIMGATSITGATAITGATQITGATDITGVLAVTGLITAPDVITEIGISLDAHTHTTTAPGAPTGPPIPAT